MAMEPKIQKSSRRQLLGGLMAALFGAWWAKRNRVDELPRAEATSREIPSGSCRYVRHVPVRITESHNDRLGKATRYEFLDPDQHMTNVLVEGGGRRATRYEFLDPDQHSRVKMSTVTYYYYGDGSGNSTHADPDIG